MRFGVLGPFTIEDDGVPLRVTPQQADFLCRLIVEGGRSVSVDRLLMDLYGDDAFGDVYRRRLRTLVSNVRKALGGSASDSPVVGTAAYRLDVENHACDVADFGRLIADAQHVAERDPRTALEMYETALGLVRGTPYEGVDLVAVDDDRRRVEELRRIAEYGRIEALVDLGREAEVVADLRALVTQDPVNEGYTGRLMVALYRSGDQPAALDAYYTLEGLLRDQHGLEPKPELRDLSRQIFEQSLPRSIRRPPFPESLGAGVDDGQLDPYVPNALVAREDALAEISERFHVAGARGRPQYILISGVAGVGKTRLAQEAARLAYAQGAIVLHGRVEPDLQPPYGPFAEILRYLLRAGEREVLPSREMAQELVRISPELGRVYPDLAAPMQADSATERFRLLESLIEWLSTLSAKTPLVLVIDDLHRATRSTLDAIRYVVQSPTAIRLVIVATARTDRPESFDGLLGGHVGTMQQTQSFSSLPLSGLAADAVVAYVESVAGGALDESAASLVGSLDAYVGGNPFYVSAWLRHLVMNGVVRRGADGSWFAPTVERLVVPPTIRDLVLERFTDLDEDDFATLEMAALMAPDVDPAVLARGAGRQRSDLGALLQRLSAMNVIIAETDSHDRADRRRFTHDLLRETLVGSIDPLREGHLHGEIAEAIESEYRLADRPVDALSYHYTHSVPDDDARFDQHMQRALHYSSAGAEAAEANLAYAEAATFFGRMVEVLASPRVDSEQEEEIRLLTKQGRALRRAADPQAGPVLVRACMLAEGRTHGEADRAFDNAQLEPHPGEPVAYPTLLAEAALANTRGTFSVWGSEESAIRSAWLARALETTVELDDGITAAKLQARLSMESLYLEPDLEGSLERAEGALADAMRAGAPADDLLRIMNDLHHLLWRPDKQDRRAELIGEMAVLSEAAGGLHWRWAVQSFTFQLASESGDRLTAEDALETMNRLSSEIRQPRITQWTRLRGAVWEAVGGNLAESERLAAEAYRRGAAGGSDDAQLFQMGQLWTLRFHQQRLEEIVPLFLGAFDQSPWLPVIPAALAAAAAEERDRDTCRRWLDSMSPLTLVRRDQDQLAAIAALTVAANFVRDAELAGSFSEVLEPARDSFIDNGTSYHGSAALYMALNADTLGRWDDADDLFAYAVERHLRIGSDLFVGTTQLAWAESLEPRAGERALEQAESAMAIAAANPGFTRLANRSAVLLDRIG